MTYLPSPAAVIADTSGKLFRVSRGKVREIANLAAYENEVNPDGGDVDPNPFDVEVLEERQGARS